MKIDRNTWHYKMNSRFYKNSAEFEKIPSKSWYFAHTVFVIVLLSFIFAVVSSFVYAVGLWWLLSMNIVTTVFLTLCAGAVFVFAFLIMVVYIAIIFW